MNLSTNYKWLNDIQPPKMVVEALKLYNILEGVGLADNPVILEWAKELGLKGYTHDSIAWCGLFVGIVAKRAGKVGVKDPLWAANWANFGQHIDIDKACLGDVCVYKRPGGNHVNIYLAEDLTTIHGIGGNQSDKTGIMRMDKHRLWAVRRPFWAIAQPESVKKYFVLPTGIISQNEA